MSRTFFLVAVPQDLILLNLSKIFYSYFRHNFMLKLDFECSSIVRNVTIKFTNKMVYLHVNLYVNKRAFLRFKDIV